MWSLKTRLGLIFGLVIFVLGMRAFLTVTEPYTPGNNAYVKARTRAFFETLRDPRLDGKDLVLFLGSSEAEVAFDPWGIDRKNRAQGRESITFNFSMRDASAHYALYLFRFAKELRESGRRPKAIITHFSVSRLTRSSTSREGTMFKFQDVWSVYFSQDLWGKLGFPYLMKVKIWFEKYILGEHSPDQIPTFFTNHFTTQFKIFDKPITNAMVIWKVKQFNPPLTQLWGRRGHFYGMSADDAPFVNRIRTLMSEPGEFDRFVENQEFCCDFLSLRLDPVRAEHVIRAYRELAQLTDNLVIVDLPESPQVNRSPESAQKRSEIFQYIAREGGARLFTPPPFPAEEFMDPVHLSPRGVARLSRWMSELKVDEFNSRKSPEGEHNENQ